MASSYIDKTNVIDAFRDSKSYMSSYHDETDEQDRIARGKPHPGIDKAYPKVTDMTTHSIIVKTPRRIIQQVPTGSIVDASDDWLKIMAGFIFSKIIIPNANQQFSLLQKCWQVTEKTLAHGSQFGLVSFVNKGQYFGTDVSIPFVKDVFYESGKVSDLDSNCIFVRAWYQKADIRAIIRREEMLKRMDKSYRSAWNLRALAKIEDQLVAKTDDQSSKYDKTKNNAHKAGIPIIHAFQNGIGAEFYSFHETTGDIVRTKENKDPRGVIPGSTMYYGSDGVNPLGRGLVESVGPLQNLMDSEMQMYQFERALMLAPPTIKKGNWNKSQAKLIPNAIIDLGSDPNASWEVLKRESSALNQFATNYGLMKSQLLTVASAPDASISATSGNPSFSKTDAGVDMQQANVSVDDNHLRKQFETWFENIAETKVNLYFAERQGVEDIKVDDDTAQKLRKINESLVNDQNIVRMDFSSATEKLKFEIDASSSNMKDNVAQLEALDGLIGRLEKSPILQSIIPPKKIIGAWNSIVVASGVENPEELSVSDDELAEMEAEQQAAMEEQAMQEQMMAEAAAQEQMQMEQPMPEEQIPDVAQSAEMPAEAIDTTLSPEDEEFAIELSNMGYSIEQIDMALQLDAEGVSNEEIIATIGEPSE